MNSFKEITSKSNKTVKEVRKLTRKKYREQKGVFICEGIKIFVEALQSKVKIEYLFIEKKDQNEVISLISKYDKIFPIYIVEKDIIETMSSSVTPQGFIFAVNIGSLPKERQGKTIGKQYGKVFVYLDGLQDPGNLGTIIRTSHGVLVDGIFIGENTVDPFSDKAVRSTMGSLFKVPISYKTKKDLIKYKEKGFSIVVTSLEANKSIYETDLRGDTIIVIGNEGQGVTKEIQNIADKKVIIPMPGNLESLNAGVSFSVIVYERYRQTKQINE